MQKNFIKSALHEYFEERKNCSGNEVIIERLDNLIESNSKSHGKFYECLEKLSIRVSNNELFNSKIKVYLSLAGLALVSFITIFINKL